MISFNSEFIEFLIANLNMRLIKSNTINDLIPEFMVNCLNVFNDNQDTTVNS